MCAPFAMLAILEKHGAEASSAVNGMHRLTVLLTLLLSFSLLLGLVCLAMVLHSLRSSRSLTLRSKHQPKPSFNI
jgi:hypothetical protein